ncbi:MAG: DUF5106 domain-containing protein [Prevotellaceae bacterium]|jgi:hypothetical protein|nr:DUF5106 domain-containing protein [Prevotellaceae bacterium]
MKTRIYLLLPLAALWCMACSNQNRQKQLQMAARAQAQADTQRTQAPTKKFQMPEVPPMLEDPEMRLSYVAEHYWMHYDFNDTTAIHQPDYAEQAWVDYINLLGMMPEKKYEPIIRQFFQRAQANPVVYRYFTEMADKYLYDPNSPLRNEELYIPVLDQMLESNLLTEAQKVRPRDRRAMAQKNRRGTRALDFNYTLESGENGSLYQITADYTLLFINNPGCQACLETIAALKSMPAVNKLLQAGRLQILSVYPDEDRGEWIKHLIDFPSSWINAYDRTLTIKSKSLYDLKAIPTLYLLDSHKMVLLKDANAPDIERYLQQS